MCSSSNFWWSLGEYKKSQCTELDSTCKNGQTQKCWKSGGYGESLQDLTYQKITILWAEKCK